MKTTVFPRRTKSFLLVKLKFLPSETKSSSRWNKKFFLMKLKFSADETVVSCRKNKHILSSCSLKIFTLLDFILGISIHILVTTLAIKSLGFQQITHRTSPRRVIISIQTQVFRSLFYGFAGNLHLLVSVIQIILGLFHPDNQAFTLVRQLIFGILPLQLLFLHIVRTTPPSRKRDRYRGKAHPE